MGMSVKIKYGKLNFDQLVSEYTQLISKICYMYATDGEHFKDLYQESLINIWQGIEKYRGDASVSTWVYRVVLNTCVSYYRRNSRHLNVVPLDVIAEPEAADDSRNEDLRMLYNLISRLGKLDKALILLWLDEKSYDEIAVITGLTKSNVAVRLNRIKKRLTEMNAVLNS